MNRTIRVTGTGKLSVKPDLIRVLMCQEGTYQKYETALAKSAEGKRELDQAMAEIGIAKEELKTQYFHVGAVYEGYNAPDGSWKQRLSGYRFTHRIKVELDNDNTRLVQIMNALAHMKKETEFSVEYALKDEDAAKNELLAKAVQDSKAKAEVLASASGVKLGQILTVDYSWGEVEMVSRVMPQMMRAKAMDSSMEMEMEAENIAVEDTVTVVFEIA